MWCEQRAAPTAPRTDRGRRGWAADPAGAGGRRTRPALAGGCGRRRVLWTPGAAGPRSAAACLGMDVAALLAAQGGVLTRAQVQAAGQPLGRWVRVAHGVYTPAATWERARHSERRTLLLRGAARLLRHSGGPLLSHQSAAQLWGLPLLHRNGRVTFTVPGPAPARSGHIAGRYVAPVPPEQRARLDGLPVTSLARTVADLCRVADAAAAQVVADGGLARGLDPAEVARVLDLCAGWPYTALARTHLAAASPWSESALESVALLWTRLQGLPRPEQQLTIRTLDGRFLARADQAWPRLRTVGELDGRGKYDGPGALWAEKQREDALRDAGLEVVRAGWADAADDGAGYAERLQRAFARAALRQDPLRVRFVDERVPLRDDPSAA